MKNIATFILFSIIIQLTAHAYDFEVDGIHYNRISAKEGEVSLEKANTCSGEIVIPSEITSEGNTYTVTAIARRAFQLQDKITSVTIPGSIQDIGYEAFSMCENLKAVFVGEGVKTMQPNTFFGCTALQRVVLPSSLTTLEKGTFANCISLTEVVLPEGLTTIKGFYHHYSNEPGAFDGCTSLRAVYFPSTITEIGSYAFYDCTALESIEIPETVHTVDKGAFFNCSGLKSVTLPSGLTTISPALFYGCSELKSVNMPENVTEIGESAFYNCFALYDIKLPDGLTKIGNSAFLGCKSLVSIEIPIGIKEIVSTVFTGCTRLLFVTVSNPIPPTFSNSYTQAFTINPNSILYVPTGSKEAYSNANLWKSFPTIMEEKDNDVAPLIIDGILYKNIQGSDNKAFAVCTNSDIRHAVIAREVTLGGQNYIVTSLADYSFAGCTSLESVQLSGNISSLGNYSFSGCSGLKSFIIPSAVSTIGESLFYSCSGLESINIPHGVSVIGKNAFYGCSSLTSVDIPTSVKEINSSFARCIGLTDMIIPESVTVLGSGSFSGCTGLKSVEIPGSISEIANDSFMNCTNLTSVKLGEGIQTISCQAFLYCDNLATIDIPESVTLIDEGAFICNRLRFVTVHSKEPFSIKSETKEDYGSFRISGNSVLYVPEGAKEAFSKARHWSKFPHIIEGSVSEVAQKYVDGILYIQRPDIENEVYATTSELNLRNANVLSEVDIDGKNYEVSMVGDYAFLGCSQLEEISIPRTVRKIGMGAFQGCTGLASIALPNTIDELPEDVFYNTNFKTLFMPASVQRFGMTMHGRYLDKVIIEDGDTPLRIPSYNAEDGYLAGDFFATEAYVGRNLSFQNGYASDPSAAAFGSNLRKVTFGPNVTEIAGGIFYRAHSVQEIAMLCKKPFSRPGGLPSTILKVPFGTYEAYASSSWKGYKIQEVKSISLSTDKPLMTYCPEYDLDFSDSDVKAYTVGDVNIATGEIQCHRVSTVPAGVGILLVSEPGTYEIQCTNIEVPKTAGISTGSITGTFLYSDQTKSRYLMSEDGIFNKVSEYGLQSADHIAYITLPTYEAPEQLHVSLTDGGLNGIESVDANSTEIIIKQNVITALKETHISIWHSDGCSVTDRRLYTGESITLPEGLYLIRTTNATIKAILR